MSSKQAAPENAPPSEPDPLNAAFAESLYTDFLKNPASVTGDWREYFLKPPGPGLDGESSRGLDPSLWETARRIAEAYRARGHFFADVNPLEPRAPPALPDLDPSLADLPDRVREALRPALERLENTYCRNIGAQFAHIDDIAARQWLAERMEATENRLPLSREDRIEILAQLTDAALFEEFIQKKYLGAKTFSLEGSESLIPLLHQAIEKAGRQGIDEIVLAMAHRGRLNVLANVLGKNPREIFGELEDAHPERLLGRGDVRYHLGFSSDRTVSNGKKIHLSLCFNPSHVEFVNPVALGRLRAKQDSFGDLRRDKGMALLIHGDAGFAGEGIIQEILNMSELPGYRVGGTLHVIVNNQIGYTTSPAEGRSTPYASDVAKLLRIPIFHVNGEAPEAVAAVVDLAMDFRKTFSRDAVIDLIGYRRRGHNESDEPGFTQPLLYRRIAERKPVHEAYLERLLGNGEMTREEADRMAAASAERLEARLAEARSKEYSPAGETVNAVWRGFRGGPEKDVPEADTAVPADKLASLMDRLIHLPENFHLHPKLEKLRELRRKMGEGKHPLDWATAESLALASLAMEGVPVRFTGQDSQRGTFSNRHAALHDVENGEVYIPLQHLGKDQAPVEIHNSPLNECGVLGFEYGYSLDRPDGLVLWEAQFGDFANAAQVIIDQFVASAEDKWRRLSGLVLLLPHGFEGMGPEHSSARLERFLALAAGDNIQVANPSTPAQYFHLLRRQALRPWRKPLVILTPKSLLRQPRAASPLEDLASGGFHRILPDPAVPAEGVKRVLLCSGKIVYDLEEEREKLGRKDTAILRLEQLYPLDPGSLAGILSPFPKDVSVTWVQEEPENMGAWRYLRHLSGENIAGGNPFHGVCRPASSSPATGSAGSHHLEQSQLLARAFEESPA